MRGLYKGVFGAGLALTTFYGAFDLHERAEAKESESTEIQQIAGITELRCGDGIPNIPTADQYQLACDLNGEANAYDLTGLLLLLGGLGVAYASGAAINADINQRSQTAEAAS